MVMEEIIVGSLIPSIFAFAMFVILMLILKSLFEKSNSEQYRESMTNMYVVGKIKQLAEEDKIDVVKEYDDFQLWSKKLSLKRQTLDETIEEELQEKIALKEKKKNKQ